MRSSPPLARAPGSHTTPPPPASHAGKNVPAGWAAHMTRKTQGRAPGAALPVLAEHMVTIMSMYELLKGQVELQAKQIAVLSKGASAEALEELAQLAKEEEARRAEPKGKSPLRDGERPKWVGPFDRLDAGGPGEPGSPDAKGGDDSATEVEALIREQLRQALARSSSRVMDLFKEWDDDRSGSISKREFMRAIKALALVPDAPDAEIATVFDEFDADGSGLISFKELNKKLRQGGRIRLHASLLPRPFALVVTYNGAENTTSQLRAYMRAMAAANASVIMEVPRRWLVPELDLRSISQLATALADEPNLYGWYLVDEPDKERSAVPVPTLVAARGVLRAAAPAPIFAALCTNLTLQSAAPWARAVDVRLFDMYPCRSAGPGFHEEVWQVFGSLMRAAAESAPAFAGGMWATWQGTTIDGPQKGWRQCTEQEDWLMLVAAAVSRAKGLLYYRLATNPGVVNASVIAHEIVPTVGALADEMASLTSADAERPLRCDTAEAANVSTRLVARRQGGWLLLAVRWADASGAGAGAASGPAIELRCEVPQASTASALDGPAALRRSLTIVGGVLSYAMRPFTAAAIWLDPPAHESPVEGWAEQDR